MKGPTCPAIQNGTLFPILISQPTSSLNINQLKGPLFYYTTYDENGQVVYNLHSHLHIHTNIKNVNIFTIGLACYRLGIWKLRDKMRDVEKEDAPYVTTKRL